MQNIVVGGPSAATLPDDSPAATARTGRVSDAAGCVVTVCRGCCCGSATKHPGVDHDRQVRRLRDALPAAHRVRVSDCLDVCEQSNVVVVQPSPAARGAGARPVWFGLVLDDAVVDDIVAWVGNGGPGRAPISDVLRLSVVPRPQ